MSQAGRPPARSPNVVWALFGLDGRINREVFWLSLLFVNFASGLFLRPTLDPETNLVTLGPLAPFVFSAALWILIALAAKRLHDRGYTGWIAGLVLVPIVGIVAFVVIGLMPGDRGANAFAPATNSRGPQ